VDAVIGLGANIGDRLSTLSEAVRRIRSLGQVTKISPLYRTRPLGPPQPDFLNAALYLSFEGEAPVLLAALLRIEHTLGRVREERWGPRTIDLDILWSPTVVVNSPRLTIPHPRLTERAFALVPMLSIVPDAQHPMTGLPYAQHVRRLDLTGVEPILEPRWHRKLDF
jgi:2-amino-4-hydroxy-6-hydroxymethyldihydropteridine diphosphokinase